MIWMTRKPQRFENVSAARLNTLSAQQGYLLDLPHEASTNPKQLPSKELYQHRHMTMATFGGGLRCPA